MRSGPARVSRPSSRKGCGVLSSQPGRNPREAMVRCGRGCFPAGRIPGGGRSCAQRDHGIVAQSSTEALAQLLPRRILLRALVEQGLMGRREGWQIASQQTHGGTGAGSCRCSRRPRVSSNSMAGSRSVLSRPTGTSLSGRVRCSVQTETLDAAVPPGEEGGSRRSVCAMETAGAGGTPPRNSVRCGCRRHPAGSRTPEAAADARAGCRAGPALRPESVWRAVARQGEQLMKMAQAHAYQRCADFTGQAEALYRQYPERLMQRGCIGHGQPSWALARMRAAAGLGARVMRWRKPRAVSSSRRRVSNRGQGPNRPRLECTSSSKQRG